MFQPAFESSALAEIDHNTLLQKETGWLIVACAVGIVGSVCLYCADSRRATIWAMLVVTLGAVILGATVYQVTGGRDALEGGSSNLLDLLQVFHGSPAVGLYAAEASGVLAVLAGLTLTGLSLRPPRRAPAPRGDIAC